MRPILHCLCLLLATVPILAHERENQALSQHLGMPQACRVMVQSGWDSRYHSEGRDALDGDSLWRHQLQWGLGPWAAGLWYGNSPDRHYDEMQLSLAHSRSFGDFEATLGYTHLRFPFEDADDHEISIGMAYTACPLGLEVALDAYHSFEADGFFAEASLSRSWQLSERLEADLSWLVGANQGYVADGHDGANHLALSAGLSHALNESLALKAHATWSQAIARKRGAAGDELLRDFFHAGLGLEWSF